jgi:Holliday junction resolvase RusA-like endonuclease
MAVIDKFIELVPIPKGRPKFRRAGAGVIAYTPKTTREYEAEIRRQCSRWTNHLIDGPVCMKVVFYLPIPKSWSKKNKELARAGQILPTKKPDFDNLVKALVDGLIPSKGDPSNPGLLRDDNQITDFAMRKRYSDRPGIRLQLSTLDDYQSPPQ